MSSHTADWHTHRPRLKLSATSSARSLPLLISPLFHNPRTTAPHPTLPGPLPGPTALSPPRPDPAREEASRRVRLTAAGRRRPHTPERVRRLRPGPTDGRGEVVSSFVGVGRRGGGGWWCRVWWGVTLRLPGQRCCSHDHQLTLSTTCHPQTDRATRGVPCSVTARGPRGLLPGWRGPPAGAACCCVTIG